MPVGNKYLLGKICNKMNVDMTVIGLSALHIFFCYTYIRKCAISILSIVRNKKAQGFLYGLTIIK